jgi:hypothetical protein
MINTIIIILVIALLWSVWGFFSSNVERADYIVEKKMQGYEIRKYPERIVAQTKVSGPYGESMNEGFRILAGYIFGENTKKESIAMTTPVIAQNGDRVQASESIAMTAPVVATTDGDLQVISFGMPRSHTLETLPKPNDSRIEIIIIPAKRYGVMRFSWYRSDEQIKKMQKKLLFALTRDEIVSSGNTAYAGYNAPWTPPWMVRNEVLVEIK